MRVRPADILRLQGARPGVHGYELVDGEPVEVTPANLEHGRIAVRLAHRLAGFVDEHGGGARDFQQRIQDYLNRGVRLLWVVHPDARAATVYHPDGTARLLQQGDALGGEDVLPGFRLPLEELLG